MPSCDTRARSSPPAIKSIICKGIFPWPGVEVWGTVCGRWQISGAACRLGPGWIAPKCGVPASFIRKGYKWISFLTSFGDAGSSKLGFVHVCRAKDKPMEWRSCTLTCSLTHFYRKYRRADNEILAPWSTLPRILNCKLTNFCSKVQTINKILCEKWSLLFLC